MKSILLFLLAIPAVCFAQNKQRARELGIPLSGITGKFNAITDVPGVEVGYKTLISGDGKLEEGKGPIRTGVTVVLPKGKTDSSYPAAYFSQNGDGEMTGVVSIDDYGFGYGPVGITNTNSVGTVRDAIGQWCFKKFSDHSDIDFSFGMPVVGETWDGSLNDINGFHIKTQHVWDAIDSSHGGKIAEGNVGGGTGMWLYGFKGGSGTASRIISINKQKYTVGVFVQANFGRRPELTIAGAPVGKEITDLTPLLNPNRRDGSIIVIVGTDAPLLPGILKLVAKRASMGVARTGAYASNGSGDIFYAFSTMSVKSLENGLARLDVLPKSKLDEIYKSTVEAVEEAIINALLAAEDMQGINNNKLFAIPHDRLKAVLRKYNRLNESPQK